MSNERPKDFLNERGKDLLTVYFNVPSNDNRQKLDDSGHPVDSHFCKDFLKSIKPGSHHEGLLTMYLYYDSPQDIGAGAFAWNEVLRRKESGVTNNSYNRMQSDLAIQSHVLSCHPEVLEDMPDENLIIVEYGSGGKDSVEKPIQLIRGLGDKVAGYVALDILGRFASESALAIHHQFNRLAIRGIEGDFMRKYYDLDNILPTLDNTVNMATIFGGTIANAPLLQNGLTKTPVENAAYYMTKIRQQNGPMSCLWMTYDFENDSQALEKAYNTGEMKNLVFSAFTRAIDEKVITDPYYAPDQFWDIRIDYDKNDMAIKASCICKKAHIMQTCKGAIDIPQGHSFTPVLSHKWGQHVYREILNIAGYKKMNFFEDPDTKIGLVLAHS